MKHKSRVILLATAFVGLLTAAFGQTPDAEIAPSKTTLAFVTNNASDYWTIARRGCERAQKELPGVDVKFIMPASGTASEQKQILDDLVTKGVQGIAISPIAPANQTQDINAVAKKTVVITQDSDAPYSDRACYVGTDNYAAGMQAGELIKEALPRGGKIMLFVGIRDAQNAKDRASGIRDALKGSRIQIIDTRTDTADRARAVSNAADTMVKYPHIAALVGLWSYNGPAILQAVRAAQEVGKVKVVCFDEEPDTLAGVKSGAIYATVVQQPEQIGYQSIKLLARLAQGDRAAIPVGRRLFVPTLAIKKGNVDAFAAKLHQMRDRP